MRFHPTQQQRFDKVPVLLGDARDGKSILYLKYNQINENVILSANEWDLLSSKCLVTILSSEVMHWLGKVFYAGNVKYDKITLKHEHISYCRGRGLLSITRLSFLDQWYGLTTQAQYEYNYCRRLINTITILL